MKIGLVSCSKNKKNYRCPAKEMYKVATQLKKILKRNDRVYFHAGAKYRGILIPLLVENKCFVPLAGMGIGKQLRFYGKHRKPNP